MKRFLVIQHSHSEFLGSFERLLEDRHIGFTYCRPFIGDHLPATAIQYDALMLLGGCARLDEPGLEQYRAEVFRVIAAFRRVQRPVVGFGYGALLVAMQCGGRAADCETWHASFVRARALGGGALAGAMEGEIVLSLHRGQVCLPGSAEVLARDESGDWLIARADPATYALRFRPEVKPGMLEDMVMEGSGDLPDHFADLIADAKVRWSDTESRAQRLFAALVSTLDLMRERPKPSVIPVRVAKA